MAMQYGQAAIHARLDAIETTIGVSAKLQIRSGAAPATPATADSGTLLCEMTLPVDYLNAASAGTKTKLGTWSGTGAAAGSAGHFRLKDNAATVTGIQGSVGVTVPLTTNALTAANSAVLNFAATTGAVAGMNISGTGVPANATVVAVTGTTVTMSHVSTAGVANAAAITFAYDMPIDNVVIAVSQPVTINSFVLTGGQT